ncbi:MAG: LysM peptidoglycan-binding domain-containing protein [Deltaproteobacteria bacterium]|nr:LysM peptidoglycan-binding domain-containing protein [Deltaproteobacteria bacterium]
MRVKLIAVSICVSFSLLYDYALAEKRGRKAEERGNVPQQTSWVRRGGMPRQIEDGEYTVREGDTLWDISESFLQDPFKWPNLWKKNQYIINPHLIYPGNKIRLFPYEPVEAGEKGKEAGAAVAPAAVIPEGLPVEKLQKSEEAVPAVTEEKPKAEVKKEETIEAQATPPPPAVKISSSMMERHGLISAKEKGGVGVIVDSKEEKLLLSANDIVFISLVKGAEVKQGDRFTVFTTTGEIMHPVTDKPIGFMTDTLGILQVTQIDKDGVISAKIEKSYKEILKGAKLKPYEPPVQAVVVKKAENAVDGFIIASLEGKVGVAENDIVYLDKGKNSGLEVGNAMNIFRPTTTVKDPMSQEEGKTIILPPKELGGLVIIAIEDDTATAFITKSKQVIYKGDRVRTVDSKQ